MSIRLQDYQEVAGPGVIEELRVLAGRVAGRRMQHINSTPVGGGVAEILTRLVPLIRELGLEATWDVIKGDQAFFSVTKAFHNALHGKPEEITEQVRRKVRRLNDVAAARGQSLAQMALAWVLRGGRVSSVVIGASKPGQIDDCVGALEKPDFSPEDLAKIDEVVNG